MNKRLLLIIVSVLLVSSISYIALSRDKPEPTQENQDEDNQPDESGSINKQEEDQPNIPAENTDTSTENTGINQSIIHEDTITEKLAEIIEYNKTILSSSPLDFEDIEAIVPLGAMNPPGHVFPTDHIYFYLTRDHGSDRPHTVPLYSPGELTITSIKASQHVLAGITDYTLILESEANPDLMILFGHVSSIDHALASDLVDIDNWTLETEYSTGGETYRSYRKPCNIDVGNGQILGTAGGNPGQWALDLFAYDNTHQPEQVANKDRWRHSNYLNAIDPLNLYEKGPIVNSLRNLVQGNLGNNTEQLILQDILATAQGCWFHEEATSTYPEDPHIALVRSNIDINKQIVSVGVSVNGLESGEYEFTPNGEGYVNREFSDVSPDENIYGYELEGYNGLVILKMVDELTIWVEAIGRTGDWEFTEHKTVFIR